ncbi:MraY family glycosyltransferase [Roseospirillum parvum]|uniref:UDP-N-acetylmuramyl pentapeptide phosphotransferase/UDP-N-acetylglucosamine-1-phosphate transferase n=1 Tax=Roseospirillum parvum TaxID=83401 RepID=A0A1G7W333_9PROT|nr:glycosyltransferase family 4 protein [Roseospirillum parvum]SDG66432.1 UDP-N-acetylmuramyl pentapeptide phosphotransferase/UDP-N-acetylglucosamine-1-phosphate transferase [Roseospirillum parvum]
MSPGLAVALLAALVGLAWLATAGALRWLRHRQVLDMPNHRSSHHLPTPRGGGLAVIGVGLAALLAHHLTWGGDGLGQVGWVLAAALLLAGVSWLDDIRGLPAVPRLIAHLAAAGIGVAALPGEGLPGLLPGWIEAPLLVVAWAGFLNVVNFMDGIDGITGVEGIAIAAGAAVVGWQAALPGDLAAAGLIVACVLLGFLPWNWHRAKLFLGDVGSIPLGYLLGWLLLLLAVKGQWAAALILPLYYLVDGGQAILTRLMKGENILTPHRRHAYQKAVDAGWPHDRVAALIGVVNLALVALALGSVGADPAGQGLALLAALGVVGVLIWLLAGRRPGEAA